MCYNAFVNYRELIESTTAYKNFLNEFMADKLSQAYLFVCEDGLTCKELILHLAKLLVCTKGTICNECGNCKKANAGSHPDILIYPKGKSFAVSDASDIYDNAQVKPMLAQKKVFVINDMDQATEQAQNKMLKVIEEPPQNVIFLIGTKNENKVLKTIISRVQKIYIDKINKELLKNIINCQNNIKEIAINFGDGYLGKTLDIAQNNEFLINYNNMKNLIINLKNSAQVFAFSKYLYENKTVFENCLLILNDFFRDLLMLNLGQQNLVKNANLINDFNLVLNEYSPGALIEIIKRINLAQKKLDSNVNLTILADSVLLEILEVKFLCK